MFKSVSQQEPRETHNMAKKPPQRLAQEKDRTHICDATPMGYEPNLRSHDIRSDEKTEIENADC